VECEELKLPLKLILEYLGTKGLSSINILYWQKD
jgi:hypothetical protein